MRSRWSRTITTTISTNGPSSGWPRRCLGSCDGTWRVVRSRGRANVVELDWWQSARHGRFTITCLPAQHWSRRGFGDTNETLWCAWLVGLGPARYFFAGDTGYFPGFAEFGQRFGPIDVAMLRSALRAALVHAAPDMDPAEAYQAFLDLRAQHMLAMHWGTFDLTTSPPISRRACSPKRCARPAATRRAPS